MPNRNQQTRWAAVCLFHKQPIPPGSICCVCDGEITDPDYQAKGVGPCCWKAVQKELEVLVDSSLHDRWATK